MKCRNCGHEATKFIKLGTMPPSNAYTKNKSSKELAFPLNVAFCKNCYLVQAEMFQNSNEIFNEEYAYFSSFSNSWLKHSNDFCNYAIKRFKLNNKSLVIELASNDGYLLNFFQKKNIQTLGIEPTISTANVAKEKGIQVITDFFSYELALKLENLYKADLIIGNNVLAHVPDINDFISGLPLLLNKNGTITFEFPHLLNLLKFKQFDTIYHEHFSYLTLLALKGIFKKYKLVIYDVQKIDTHGGSLRIFLKHKSNIKIKIKNNVRNIILQEKRFGLDNIIPYKLFAKSILKIRNNFLKVLDNIKKQNQTIIAYGAAAKGNTFLNYLNLTYNDIPFVVDKNTFKQNLFLPGSKIPIYSDVMIKKYKPNYILILPWNLKNEIIEELNYVRNWKCLFITAIPELIIF
jgi:SAM-dependent methyltransferase